MSARTTVFPLILIALVACGGGEKQQAAPETSAAAPSSPAQVGTATPDAGGKVITVELITDEKGNYFSPNKIEAKVGDVVRYTLKIGVHNVHFLPDSNPGKAGLPAPSDMLQLPGQTYDVKIVGPVFGPGSYYFQCDPHALLGMQGRLTVKQ